MSVDLLGVGPAQAVACAVEATKSLPLMSLWVRAPQASMGRMRSAVPCRTSTGMSIFGRSSRKSVCQVATHAFVPAGEALTAVFQASRTTSSLIRVPKDAGVPVAPRYESRN